MVDDTPIASESTVIAPLVRMPLDFEHAPPVSSPLNPDAARRPAPPKPPPREQREKKDSLKKRESVAAGNGGKSSEAKNKDAKVKLGKEATTLYPMRYNIEVPKLWSYHPPHTQAWASHEPSPFLTPDGCTELQKPVELAHNTKSYRYNPAVADPTFRHKQWYRSSEVPPFTARMSVEDSDKWIYFNNSTTMVTNEKGWRMSRANVLAREGSLYYEAKVIRGVPKDGPRIPPGGESSPQPHVRLGWSRREAPLDGPVGFDGYSYGVTDIRFQTIHKSRPGKIVAPGANAKAKAKPRSKTAVPAASTTRNIKIEDDTGKEDHIREGDVVGLLITLPSLTLQKKVSDGIYNPAVDVGDGFSHSDAQSVPTDIIRDRIPVSFRGSTYFEQYEYQESKPMQQYADRGPFNTITPGPNHEEPALRTLPHSSIKVYKNGAFVGTAFENLLGFLPPASAVAPATTTASSAGRTHLDDGKLGYYPSVSAFAGGIAELNFGPNFWFPIADISAAALANEDEVDLVMADADEAKVDLRTDPSNLSREQWADLQRKPRAVAERYREQIAEDIVWDIVDEASFFALDGGYEFKGEQTVKPDGLNITARTRGIGLKDEPM